jgi:ABC-2 type transport system permease protein
VVTEDVGTPARELSRFSLTAPQNLVLFTFINSIASAAFLVQTRRSGVLRRALSSPVPLAVQLAGLALGWFAFALVQSLAILAIGAVVFGVDWGDPVAAAVLLLAFAAVACGAGLLVGAIGNDPDRVGSISPFVGIVLGALGGCMVPLEVFPPAMSTIARFTPHYWALTSWQRLVFDGEGLGAVLPGVGVLLGVAAALLGLATVLTRRRLVQA